MRTQCTRKSGAQLDNDMEIQFGLVQAVTRDTSRIQGAEYGVRKELERVSCGKEIGKARSRL